MVSLLELLYKIFKNKTSRKKKTKKIKGSFKVSK